MKWDKVFLKKLTKLGGPILLQNLFTVMGSSVMTFMTGLLGDVPIAAAGLNNQLYFLLMLVQFGASSGSALFTAQFWGRKDRDNVLKTLGVSLLLSVGAGMFFLIIALFFPRQFVGVFTQDQEVVAIASGLLRITGFSFIFTPIVFTYSFVLRSTGNVRLPMATSITGVVINIILGYGLVFGKLGMPNLGVNGAAVALLIARAVECIALVLLTYWFKTLLAASPREIFSFDRVFFKRVVRRVFPVMMNELIWGLGITAYNAIFARLGVEAYAAMSIRQTIEDIIFVPFTGLTNACAVLVGNTIGRGEAERAHDYVRQSLAIDVILAAGLSILLFFSRGLILSYFHISETTHYLTMNVLAILAGVTWLRTMNFVFFIGMMRAGGDTHYAWLMDVLSLWFFGVPLALLGAFVLHLPVYYVYLLVMAEELLKFFLSIRRFRSRRWVHDLITA